VNQEGEVTAGDITEVAGCEVLNKDQLICTLDKKTKLEMELEVKVGRGFATGDENKHPDQPIGVIPIDSIFSPVTRVKYRPWKTPASDSAPITTSSSSKSGPTAASPLRTRFSSPPRSCAITSTHS